MLYGEQEIFTRFDQKQVYIVLILQAKYCAALDLVQHLDAEDVDGALVREAHDLVVSSPDNPDDLVAWSHVHQVDLLELIQVQIVEDYVEIMESCSYASLIEGSRLCGFFALRLTVARRVCAAPVLQQFECGDMALQVDPAVCLLASNVKLNQLHVVATV